jgi:hypothetical protein
MYGTSNVKFTIARQAKEIYQYKNIKEKLHRTNAAIWYNKSCRQLQFTPKYIAIKVNGQCTFVWIRFVHLHNTYPIPLI